MSDLAPDEKLCPYCAETIKAAAIKCRFCQSDLLTEVETTHEVEPVETTGRSAGLEPDEEPEPGPEPEPEPGDAEPAEETRYAESGGRGKRLVAAMVVLCLVLSGVLWFLVDRARHPDLETAPNGQVTDSSFRNAAMSAASANVVKVLSYNYKTFDQDRKTAEAVIGGDLSKEYATTMESLESRAVTSKLTLKATVLSAGVVSAREHSAKVLLFVNTVTSVEGSKQQQTDRRRILATLKRTDGDWVVSKMDAV